MVNRTNQVCAVITRWPKDSWKKCSWQGHVDLALAYPKCETCQVSVNVVKPRRTVHRSIACMSCRSLEGLSYCAHVSIRVSFYLQSHVPLRRAG